MGSLSGKTYIITGASRGIGKAIALRLAREGANIVIAAKSVELHPKLKGSIFEVAEEVEGVGGKALAIRVDVRFQEQVVEMVNAAVDKFEGIDGLVNNAGAISLTGVEKTRMKVYDLMQDINHRAVFLCSRSILPHLKKSANPHILSLSPPLNFNPKWLKDFSPYALSKYGMTMFTIGMSAELEPYGIAVNSLWPQTYISTAAIEFAVGNREMFNYCRRPEIMADAAYEILRTENRSLTGQSLIDEQILRERGVTDFDQYAYNPEYAGKLKKDIFLD